ncbi:hypothetical protein NDU88_000950 [Pleurodeles waltl]|uniref:Uncharacterized protein n=1 Tax=Pleurodeles waltl TaxID=8319 RepID=A0AAV7SYZ6_PLEWA|nr:hypothetical protein NDU88_000950 [Pleurodeles waltl]
MEWSVQVSSVVWLHLMQSLVVKLGSNMWPDLGASDAVQAVEVVGGIDVIVVIEMKVEDIEKNVVLESMTGVVMKSAMMLQMAGYCPGGQQAKVPLMVALLSVEVFPGG